MKCCFLFLKSRLTLKGTVLLHVVDPLKVTVRAFSSSFQSSCPMFRCISRFHSPHGYSHSISGWLHVSEHGGLTLAGGQMPAQPLSAPRQQNSVGEIG